MKRFLFLSLLFLPGLPCVGQEAAAPVSAAPVSEAPVPEAPVSSPDPVPVQPLPDMVYTPAPGGGQRMLSQAEVDGMREKAQKALAGSPSSKELAFPAAAPTKRPDPVVKKVSFMEGMSVLASGQEWTAIPTVAILFTPPEKKKYFSTEADQAARDPKPDFVTDFPGSFFPHVKLVEVTPTESGYSFPEDKLVALTNSSKEILVAVFSGIPVRMPVVLEKTR